MLGFIHLGERYAEPRLGEVLNVLLVFVRWTGPESIPLSHALEMLENDAQMILTYLEANGGFMTLNDSPSRDQGNFGISKGRLKGFGWFDEGKNQARLIWK